MFATPNDVEKMKTMVCPECHRKFSDMYNVCHFCDEIRRYFSRNYGLSTMEDFFRSTTIEEIGTQIVAGNPSYYVYESTLSDLLDLTPHSPEYPHLTRVICPVCNGGMIRVLSVSPLFSRGIQTSGPMTHVGNSYDMDCSHEDCEAKYQGSLNWLHLD